MNKKLMFMNIETMFMDNETMFMNLKKNRGRVRLNT